jgi:glycerol-3-phosphate acyltransferase PlsY
MIYDKGIAIACLLFLTLSDSLAALFGKSIGKIKIKDKTLEGSIAFLLSAIVIVYFIKSLNFTVGLFGAIVATIIELFVTNINDNLSIPIISGLVMQLVKSFMM